MYKIICRNTILYTTDSKMDARANLFIEAEKKNLDFWQEISRPGRDDFVFYYKDDENEFEVYTIIKE